MRWPRPRWAAFRPLWSTPDRNNMKKLLSKPLSAVASCVVLGLFSACLFHDESSALVREAAPEVELQWLNYDGPSSLSELRGRVVLLEFWRTW